MSFLIGTALATAVVAAIGFVRSRADMAVSVQVLDGCTVGSAAQQQVTHCQAWPDRMVTAPGSRQALPVSSAPGGVAPAGSEERTHDGFTTFFF